MNTMQRLLDILFSGAALLALSPLLVPLLILLRLTGEGEIFFRQNRIGLGGRKFGLLKFATMIKDSPNIGTGTVTLKGDPRVLPVGRFLRKTKINELPQLLNILLGDMSVIGPRPQTQRCFDAFPQRSQEVIKMVRPGLSGIGSIIFRGEEDMMDASKDPDKLYDHIIMPYKGLLEEWYVERQGTWLYLKLIVLTTWIVAFRHSRAVWKMFPNLPVPPTELARDVNWTRKPVRHDVGIYRQVAILHTACLDQGFLSSLGPRVLIQLYRAIDESSACSLHVEKREGRVVGFVASGQGMGPIFFQMLRHPFSLAVALMPLLLQPRKIIGILEILHYGRGHRAKTQDVLPEHELLCIAVALEARGSGVAEHLYTNLVGHFRDRGIGAFRIVVGDALASAHRFYRRMGAKPVSRIELHGGQGSVVYVWSAPHEAPDKTRPSS